MMSDDTTTADACSQDPPSAQSEAGPTEWPIERCRQAIREMFFEPGSDEAHIVLATDARAYLTELGFKEQQIQRAKRKLGIRSVRGGDGRKGDPWVWLPPTDWLNEQQKTRFVLLWENHKTVQRQVDEAAKSWTNPVYRKVPGGWALA